MIAQLLIFIDIYLPKSKKEAWTKLANSKEKREIDAVQFLFFLV